MEDDYDGSMPPSTPSTHSPCHSLFSNSPSLNLNHNNTPKFYLNIIRTWEELSKSIPTANIHPRLIDNGNNDEAKEANLAVLPSEPRNLAAFYGPDGSLAKHLQRILTHYLERNRFDTVKDKLPSNDPDLARINSLRSPAASSWLICTPSDNSRTFTNIDWRMAHRLRRDLIPHRGLTKCICGYDFQHRDAFPSHFLFCEKYKNSSGLLRHNRILEQTLSFCRTAGIVATSYPLQPGGELSHKQPDGQQWFDEALNFSDVTVRHPGCPSYLNRFKGNPGKLLDSAVTQKFVSYLLWGLILRSCHHELWWSQ